MLLLLLMQVVMLLLLLLQMWLHVLLLLLLLPTLRYKPLHRALPCSSIRPANPRMYCCSSIC